MPRSRVAQVGKLVLVSAVSAIVLAAFVPHKVAGSQKPMDTHSASLCVELSPDVPTPQAVWVEVFQIDREAEEVVLMAPMVIPSLPEPERPLEEAEGPLAIAAQGEDRREADSAPTDDRLVECGVLVSCMGFVWRSAYAPPIQYVRHFYRVSDAESYWVRVRTGESVVAEPQVQQLFPDGKAEPGRYLGFAVRAKAAAR